MRKSEDASPFFIINNLDSVDCIVIFESFDNIDNIDSVGIFDIIDGVDGVEGCVKIVKKYDKKKFLLTKICDNLKILVILQRFTKDGKIIEGKSY